MTERTSFPVAGRARQRRRGVRGASWGAGSARLGRAEDDVHGGGCEPFGTSGSLREVSQTGVVAHHSLCLDGDGREFPKGEGRKTPMPSSDFTEGLALARPRGEHGAVSEAIGEATIVWPTHGGLASAQREQQDSALG